MYTLGINAVYHDSAACLVEDGRVLAAAEEERFTHVKHGKRPIPFSTYELPFNAIDYCLREAGIDLVDVDHVAYSYDPYLLLGRYSRSSTITLPLEPSAHPVPAKWEAAWDPLFMSHIVNAPRHLAGGVPLHLQARFRGASVDGPFYWHFVEHHTAHAASAFHASPFDQAAVLTLDGRGERATTTYNMGLGNRLERLGQVNMPHSLGILYEQVTAYLGFLHSSDEYKVMALASFGKPTYLNEFRDIVRLGHYGQYTIKPPRLEERFGPPRMKGGPLEQRHYDIAHSLQVALEEAVLEIASWLRKAAGSPNLCIAGGVALNCVMNARLRDRGPFERIWVQPAAGDAGTALGAALWIDAQERGGDERRYLMDHAFLGPAYGDAEIEHFLLERATADAVLYLDDDVLMEPWVARRLLDTLRSQGCGFVGAFPAGLSFRDDLRPEQQVLEPWEGLVRPEVVEPGSREWERWHLHRAANLYHVSQSLRPGEFRLYKIAWIASCVMYDRRKLLEVGGFSFWGRLPRYHSGEEVLVQNLLPRRWGGCGIMPSGTYYAQLPSTVLNPIGAVDGHALDLLPEMVQRYAHRHVGLPSHATTIQ